MDWDQGENGLLQIVVQGETKFRLCETWVDNAKLRHGTVELLPAEVSSSVPGEFSHLAQTLEQILEQVSGAVNYPNPEYNDSVWLGSRFVELLPLSAELRHELLAMDSPLERLNALAEVFDAIAQNRKEN